MAKKTFCVSVLITVPADTYKEAQENALQLVDIASSELIEHKILDVQCVDEAGVHPKVAVRSERYYRGGIDVVVQAESETDAERKLESLDMLDPFFAQSALNEKLTEVEPTNNGEDGGWAPKP